MNTHTCPICQRQEFGLWRIVASVELKPSRCSKCLRDIGPRDITVAEAQALLAARLESEV